ncbi:MAG: hypothetical protein IJD28_04415 [Deferribacterales bacterium]|nr:hypothetical protein [Deferribacterales bacterium]
MHSSTNKYHAVCFNGKQLMVGPASNSVESVNSDFETNLNWGDKAFAE